MLFCSSATYLLMTVCAPLVDSLYSNVISIRSISFDGGSRVGNYCLLISGLSASRRSRSCGRGPCGACRSRCKCSIFSSHRSWPDIAMESLCGMGALSLLMFLLFVINFALSGLPALRRTRSCGRRLCETCRSRVESPFS